MRKTLFIFLFIFAAAPGCVFAAVESTVPNMALQGTKNSFDPQVNFERRRALEQITNLEHKIQDLTRTNRDQDDRIRTLEHSIYDLRSRLARLKN